MPDHASPLLKLTLIFVGAGFGGLARHGFGTLVQSWSGPSFPFGTLAVNVVGCFVAGLLAALWTGPTMVREEYRAAILIGLLGGFTTFSAFSRDTLALVQAEHGWRAFLYVLLSVTLSLVAVWLGALMGSKPAGAPTAP